MSSQERLNTLVQAIDSAAHWNASALLHAEAGDITAFRDAMAHYRTSSALADDALRMAIAVRSSETLAGLREQLPEPEPEPEAGT